MVTENSNNQYLNLIIFLTRDLCIFPLYLLLLLLFGLALSLAAHEQLVAFLERMFRNPKNEGMGRKISFQAKSCLFSPHKMFKNPGSGLTELRVRHSTAVGGEYSPVAVSDHSFPQIKRDLLNSLLLVQHK